MTFQKERLFLKRMPVLVLIGLLALSAGSIHAQRVAPPRPIPTVDGSAGLCSVEFTVVDEHDKPVSGAKIDVHIAYGFAGVRKLDLEVQTNIDGKGRFNGLPQKVKDGVMLFRASTEDKSGSTYYDPVMNCGDAHKEITVVAKQ